MRKFISLTKPGIIFGNLLPTIASFFLASNGTFSSLLIYVILGTGLVIASGCVFNNIYDSDIDALMQRTQKRPMVQKQVSPKVAFIFGLILGFAGLFILYHFANPLSSLLGAIGLFFYVIVYTMLTKRTTVYSVHIGSISGAIPPLIGYCAVTGRLDLGALIIFVIMVIWQIPHSFAISIFNAKDYANAKIPTVFSKMGARYIKFSILVYIVLFSLANASLTLFHYTGFLHLINASALGVYWVWIAFTGFKKGVDLTKWAKKLFFASIIIITLSCITISFG